MEHKERDAIGVENAPKLLSAFTFFVMQSADLVSHLCYTLCSFRRCRNDAVPWAALSSDVLMIAGALGVRRDDVDQEGFCATRAKAKTARRTHSGRLPGYHRQAVESQMLAMLHKDLLWTTTGAPADFSEKSHVRLSYRGQLYARRMVTRTVFNYMMSFDVEMLDDAVQVAHVNRKQVEEELRLFARFDTPMPTDLMVARVLRMAAAIHEAERQEVKDLVDARARDQFRADVAPRCISADMVGSCAFHRSRTPIPS